MRGHKRLADETLTARFPSDAEASPFFLLFAGEVDGDLVCFVAVMAAAVFPC